MDCRRTRLLCHGDSLDKSYWSGLQFLFQGSFEPKSPSRWILYHLDYWMPFDTFIFYSIITILALLPFTILIELLENSTIRRWLLFLLDSISLSTALGILQGVKQIWMEAGWMHTPGVKGTEAGCSRGETGEARAGSQHLGLKELVTRTSNCTWEIERTVSRGPVCFAPEPWNPAGSTPSRVCHASQAHCLIQPGQGNILNPAARFFM